MNTKKISALTIAATMAMTMTFAETASAEVLNKQGMQSLLNHPTMIGNDELNLDPATQTKQIVKMVEVVMSPLEHKVPGIVEKFVDILDCETHNHWDGKITHLDANGNIVLNDRTQRAKGAAQLVPKPHNRSSKNWFGLDINEIDHQLVYSRFLIEDRIRMAANAKTEEDRNASPLEDWSNASVRLKAILTADHLVGCFLLPG